MSFVELSAYCDEVREASLTLPPVMDSGLVARVFSRPRIG